MRLGVVILAGGNGTRIGAKKAFLKLGEKTFVSLVHSVAEKLTDDIILVINKEDFTNPLFDFVPVSTRVTFDLKNGYGPLMGIYSGVKISKADYVLILPCDTPLVKLKLLEIIVSSINGYSAVIPRWPNGFLEPLHSVYHVQSSILAIESSFKKGEKNVSSLIKKLAPTLFIPVESLKKYDKELVSFQNINYKSDLDNANIYFRNIEN